MSAEVGVVMLTAIVKRPIPNGRPCADVASIRWLRRFLFSLLPFAIAFHSIAAQSASPSLSPPIKALVNQYCVNCHDAEVKKGGLDLERVSAEDVAQHPKEWEQVVRKLRTRQMPPVGKERPTDAVFDEVVTKLSSSLDRAAAKQKRERDPGQH